MQRRGDLTFWLDEAALAGWHAPRRRTPGGQPIYSNLAIELVLTCGSSSNLRCAKLRGSGPA
ncbi:MAG: transposase, partial [Sinobacteraceae bacterium]|nr:transposase [Nevskiaceae bacterium]